MAALNWLLLLVAAISLGGNATFVTPVEKVIFLLTHLQTEVTKEGQDESSTYDAFACFCKDTTETKSAAVTTGGDTIDALSASIQADTASKSQKGEDLLSRRKKQEEFAAELEDYTARCSAQMIGYEGTMTDLTKAIGSLEKAIASLSTAKSTALLAVRQTLNAEVTSSLALADALGLVKGTKSKALRAFIQKRVDPDNAEYNFHSADILTLLDNVKVQFNERKTENKSEWDKAKELCQNVKLGIQNMMSTNSQESSTLKGDIDVLQTKIAGERQSLVEAEDTLKDDQQYLKELTERCEAGAKDWDQRSQMRGDELKVIAQALAILQTSSDDGNFKSVKELDEAVNNRIVLLVKTKNRSSAPLFKVVSFLEVEHTNLGFLRERTVRLHRAATRTSQTLGSQDHAVDVLRAEGVRLKSTMLSELVKKIAEDPFDTVKELIQNLIERLLKDAIEEATKKGFCETEMGKATQTRKFRFADVNKLTADIKALEATKDELALTIPELQNTIGDLRDMLNTTTIQRAEERAQNIITIEQAKQGVSAVTDAIKILKAFYRGAAKGSSLLQMSPVDLDTDGPDFTGSYSGRQVEGRGIMSLLEIIRSDFERTIGKTEDSENQDQAESVKFGQTANVDIKGKDTMLERAQEDLTDTTDAIAQKITDLKTAQGLLDAALKTIEDLKPMCIDTSMTYAERSQKRDEEIAALKKVMCLLDPDKVEVECA